MIEFTPIGSAIGGALIGAAAVALHAFDGRVAGVSGIVAGLPFVERTQRGWRLLFLLGLTIGAGGWFLIGPAAPAPRSDFPFGLLLTSGLLVGYGTSMARGCTSGHGVCGVARLSTRSLVATGTFLGVALVTTYVARHLLGLAS